MTCFLGAVNLHDSALCGSLLRHYVDQAGFKNAEILTVSNAAFLPYSEPFFCNSAQSPIFVFASPKGPLSLDDPGAPFGRSKKASKTEIPAALESIYKRFGTAFPSAIQSDHSIALW